MIYLDYNSTTPVKPEVLVAMLPYLTEKFYNPSSSYYKGMEILGELEEARNFFKQSIYAKKAKEIYFVSCGSEANNWALRGVMHTGRPLHIITSNIEHHSILNTCKELEGENCKIHIIPVDNKGVVCPDDIQDVLEKINPNDLILISIMAVNNEIGTIQPIKDIGLLARKYNAYFHVDAVQAYGKIPIDVQDMNIDMLSTSSHKIGAPRGSGFLYISGCSIIRPLITGGQQENYMRAGTENVAAIKGFQKAAEIALSNMKHNQYQYKALYRYFVDKLSSIDKFKVINKKMNTIHNTISIDCGVRAESMMSFLDDFGIMVSSGSACNSRDNQPSHVLKAIGLSDAEARRVIRISMAPELKVADVNYVIEILKKGIEYLGNGR